MDINMIVAAQRVLCWSGSSEDKNKKALAIRQVLAKI
jgi:hypothetical protein